VRAPTLVEDLWAEPPGDPANALQSLISRLRASLRGVAGVELGPAGYRLALAPDEVDALRFERLARAGRRRVGRAGAGGGREPARGSVAPRTSAWQRRASWTGCGRA
jgi:hypothetical protein